MVRPRHIGVDVMEIFTQPDREKREQLAKEEEQARKDAKLAEQTTRVREGQMGNLKVWQKDTQTLPDLFAKQRQEKVLGEKAEVRSGRCWQCYRQATVWVRAVQFHLGDLRRAEVSTADYDGPVPGFCPYHLSHGPQDLAQAVYMDRPEMAWGFRPERYSVTFTDGSQHVGVCISPPSPTVMDEHIKGTPSPDY